MENFPVEDVCILYKQMLFMSHYSMGLPLQSLAYTQQVLFIDQISPEKYTPKI